MYFLKYIHFGEVWDDGRKKVRFDLERKRWIEVIDSNQNIDSLRAAFKWLHRFKADGYWDFKHVGDVPFHYQELYWIDPEEHLKVLKAELVLSHRVTIDRLNEIKNDLDFFLYDIQCFDKLYVPNIVRKVLPWGYKFTWENILRRFDLPLSYLHLFESDKNKSKK